MRHLILALLPAVGLALPLAASAGAPSDKPLLLAQGIDQSGFDSQVDETGVDKTLDNTDVDRSLDDTDVDRQLDNTDVDKQLDQSNIDETGLDASGLSPENVAQ